MNQFQKLSFVFASLALTGCSYLYSEDGLIKDRTYEYLDAKQAKDLKVPNDLKQKNKINYAQVPAIGEDAKKAPFGKDLKVNAPVQILAVLENVRLDKSAKFPTVFITDDIQFIWNNINEVFEEKEISPLIMDEAEHFIDTGWLAQDEDGIWLGLEGNDEIDEFKTRYEIHIGKGQLNNEYRIETRRVGAQRLDDETDQWVNVPNFWHDSAEMLNLIISNYDLKVAQRDKKKRNRAIANFKVELSTDEQNNAALVTSADKEDVWQKLPEVLLDLGFEVSDRDRQLMTYFVEFVPEEEGFFASLFGEEAQQLELEEGNYQVSVSEKGQQTAITLKDEQGTPIEAALLTKLYPALSARFGEKS